MNGRRARIGILATHPIQYYVPWYRHLAERAEVEVFFAQHQTREAQGAAGFGVAFDWDVPLLEGYRHRFLANRAERPDVDRFLGCDTPEIADIVRPARFDAFVVHGWATKSYWQAIWACWRSGTPVLVRGDSQLDTPRHPGWRVAKYPLYRLLVPRFDGYLVVGARARAYLRHYGADARRMFFAPHAVDNDFFGQRADGLRAERAPLRERWGIPAGATVALFCGKFIPAKRACDFARAVGAASRACPGLWGLMVGDGSLRPGVEAMARREGWPIRFAGFLNQTEIPAAYAAGDVLVLPSDSETWGLVVNEAMASGLPALVSERVGCAPDLVVEGETGGVFPVGDVAALAGGLERLARDPDGRAAQGARARRRVACDSIAAAVEGTLAAVESLRRDRRPAPRLGGLGARLTGTR